MIAKPCSYNSNEFIKVLVKCDEGTLRRAKTCYLYVRYESPTAINFKTIPHVYVIIPIVKEDS